MVKPVKIYVEGGGDRALDHTYCRKGFHKLLDGIVDRKPRIIPGGGRSATFDKFETALRIQDDSYPILLVDSEDALDPINDDIWSHLKKRDQWDRPRNVNDDQAQLMVTCMETWVMADRIALRSFFGASLNERILFPERDLETRARHEVQNLLEDATRPCGREKMYKKGERSFDVLGNLNPETLKKHLPHFNKLVVTLKKLLG